LMILFLNAALIPDAMALDNSRPVKVFLWFDTEDYILPEADDALLRISEFLDSEGIQGTFKIVGEKARVLEKRGRSDIISSLQSHEIGYHTDLHSAQPSPAMYLSDLDWAEGVREFKRREYQGYLDVARITGQRSFCYGQPGASWAPQAFEALRDWGIRVYLDSIDIIDLEKKPFWYSGVLTLCSLEHEMRVGLQEPADLDEAKERFSRARRKILDGTGPGVVSIFYHPCEFVHARFWDGVNFSQGANPAPENWKSPPMKPDEAIATGYRNFEGFVRFIKSFPEVEFVTAKQALEIYPDQSRLAAFSSSDMEKLAARVADNGIRYQIMGEFSLSAAEIFYLLTSCAESTLSNRTPARKWELPENTIGGPVSSFDQKDTIPATRDQYRRTLRDVADFIDYHSRIPDSIWLGGKKVTPESFLVTTARFLTEDHPANNPSLEMEFRPASLKTRANVQENPSWGWVIFPKGFSAPDMVERARLQTWSLKPALSRTEKTGRTGDSPAGE